MKSCSQSTTRSADAVDRRHEHGGNDPSEDPQARHEEDGSDQIGEKTRRVGMKREDREPCDDQCHRIGELKDREVLSNLRVGFPVRCPTPGMAHEQHENREEKKG